MNELAKLGKKRTILISISVLLISIHTIYYYHSLRPEIDALMLIRQTIRFLLTVGLLYATYIGKKWAKIVTIILFSLALLGAIYAILTSLELPFINTIPFYVMIFVYGNGISHFGFSKSYNAFFEYQNWIKGNTQQNY
jgi:dolichyl-phosphate-mannose--protein O-mannosyl transferase